MGGEKVVLRLHSSQGIIKTAHYKKSQSITFGKSATNIVRLKKGPINVATLSWDEKGVMKLDCTGTPRPGWVVIDSNQISTTPVPLQYSQQFSFGKATFSLICDGLESLPPRSPNAVVPESANASFHPGTSPSLLLLPAAPLPLRSTPPKASTPELHTPPPPAPAAPPTESPDVPRKRLLEEFNQCADPPPAPSPETQPPKKKRRKVTPHTSYWHSPTWEAKWAPKNSSRRRTT
eukprot:TRINITY_DN6048_c0_g1_i2.p1 TRINITY_DN6048_c0_g1~~TRINITY_DN6048_c0_g1_i2.p1  ORF type:complete len:242 (+),score=39.71 TRINITY_DN6048_c0_g1_i2:25-726(+)